MKSNNDSRKTSIHK